MVAPSSSLWFQIVQQATRITVVMLALAGLLTLGACGKSADPTIVRTAPQEAVLTPQSAREARARLRDDATPAPSGSKARAVELQGAGAKPPPGSDPTADAPSPGAPTDAQVRSDLREARRNLQRFKRYLGSTAFLRTGPQARVLPNGEAIAPDRAPDIVKRVILAGNQIAKFPYKWGGGHGAWRDNGYDCSGSVSFALAGAGLLHSPRTSGGFVEFGEAGPGKWITIYANGGHIFMYVAGLRFDTSGQGRAGTRWQEGDRPTAGFAVRHIPGL
jgi:cell wall-associated NlpC family hydrolase